MLQSKAVKKSLRKVWGIIIIIIIIIIAGEP